MAVDKSRFPAAVTDVYREAALQPRAMRSMINNSRAMFRGLRSAALEELPVVETPTLMVWGLQDTALSKETTDGTRGRSSVGSIEAAASGQPSPPGYGNEVGGGDSVRSSGRTC